MKYKIILSLSILFTILISGCKSTEIALDIPQNWVNIAAADDFEVYIDTTSMKREGSILSVREKRIYTTPESRAKYVEKIKSKNLKMYKIERWNDFSYCIYEYECDCANKRSRIIAVEDYDSTGKRILRTTPNKKNLKWKDVITDSVEDYTFFFICDYDN